MSNVIVFKSKQELSAEQNLKMFIESCKHELTVFGKDLPFDADVWDVTKALNIRTVKNSRSVITFFNWDTDNSAGTSTVPLDPLFKEFAKAYIRYTQGLRPKKAQGVRITALRGLERVLAETQQTCSPVLLDRFCFNLAAQKVAQRYSKDMAYQVGQELQLISKFLTENNLTKAPCNWTNINVRPNGSVRVGEEADKNRRDKLPSQAALEALPALFRHATGPFEEVVLSTVAILCAAPNRITEILTLPVDCEVTQQQNGKEIYGLRWWPSKGAAPMIKWVVPSMVEVVKEAIAKIKAVSKPYRDMCVWYELFPDQLWLPSDLEYLRTKKICTYEEVAKILGFADKRPVGSWTFKNKLTRVTDPQTGYAALYFEEVEKIVLAKLPKGFPILDSATGLPYSKALYLACDNLFHASKAAMPCVPAPVLISQISDGLGADRHKGEQSTSIFEKYGFTEPDGSAIKVKTHQFRHFLNTLAQQGGLSQVDIAKWSGRVDVRQNAVYDHTTPTQLLEQIKRSIGEEHSLFKPLTDMSNKVFIKRDSFAQLMVPTAHTTDLGYCIHDYALSPCQLFGDCINCQDMVCVKGDIAKTEKIALRLVEAKQMLAQVQADAQDQTYGTDRWLDHFTGLVKRLEELLTILNDESLPNGAVIQLAPPPTKNASLNFKNIPILTGSNNG